MERWDPTEIIAEPFPIEKLKYHSYGTILSIIVVSFLLNARNDHNIADNILSWRLRGSSIGTGGTSSGGTRIMLNLIHYSMNYIATMTVLYTMTVFGIVLMGASPFVNFHHTYVASLNFTFLAFGYFNPIKLVRSFDVTNNDSGSSSSSSGSNYTIWNHFLEYISRVFMHVLIGEGFTRKDEKDMIEIEKEENCNVNNDNGNENNRYIMYAVIFVTIPFQILNVLDHGSQIQRWPVPIILGSTVGHCIGCFIGFIASASSWYFGTEVKKAQ